MPRLIGARWFPIVVTVVLGIGASAFVAGDRSSETQSAADHEAGRVFVADNSRFLIANPRALLHPRNRGIVRLARRLGTPKKAFEFMRNEIAYENVTPASNEHADNVLRYRHTNCIGEATLLASLLRAMGLPAKRLRVVVAVIEEEGRRGAHSWVEYLDGNEWVVLDPTPSTDSYAFATWGVSDFYVMYRVVPVVSFNDRWVHYYPPGYYTLAHSASRWSPSFRDQLVKTCGRGCHVD